MNATEAGEKASKALADVFGKTGKGGKYVYTNEEAFDAILLLIFQLKIDVATAPDGIKAVVKRFAEIAKLPKDPTPKQLNDAVSSYFDKYPINPKLKADLERASKDVGNTVAALGAALKRTGSDYDPDG